MPFQFTQNSPNPTISDAEMFRTLAGWMEDVRHRLEGGALIGSSGSTPIMLQGVGKPGFDFLVEEPLIVVTPGTVSAADLDAFVDRSLSFLRTIYSMVTAAGGTTTVVLANVVEGTDFEDTIVTQIGPEFQNAVADINGVTAAGWPTVPDVPLYISFQ